MPERPPKPTGSDQNPPEQPVSFGVEIKTVKASLFDDLPTEVQKGINDFEGREISLFNENQWDWGGARGERARIITSSLSEFRYFGDPSIPREDIGQAIVTSVMDTSHDNLAGISVVMLDKNGKPVDTFIGRAPDDQYAMIVAPLLLAIRHKALQTKGIRLYTTRIWERSEALYQRLGLKYREVPDPHSSEWVKKVRVRINPTHTNQLFSQLGLDPTSDPFQTTYRMRLTPLPPQSPTP